MKEGHMGFGEPTVHHRDDYAIESRLKLIKTFCALENKRILDIGCGNGFYTIEFAKVADFVIGIDINKQSIDQAISLSKEQKISNVVFKCSDIEKLKLNEKFDIVIMIEVLEHLPDIKNILKKIGYWLKDGGNLVLFVPNKLYPFETHGMRFFGRNINYLGSFPFLSWAPENVRKFFVDEKIFTVNSLKRIFNFGELNL
jgi:2-polyprenyl-3-methyl-5-hydroxy-6-metoxy-1,4-benzoquinol methylase